MQKKVVLYARVSTSKDQNTEVQFHELRRFVVARGWQVVEEISDTGFSGKTDKRPGLKRLMELVRSRRTDIVVVVKLDRLFRSIQNCVVTLNEFTDLGVEFVAVSNQIDLTTATGKFFAHQLAAFAELEANLIRERTIAGLDFARANGKRLGRPPLNLGDHIRTLRAEGLSYRNIQKRLQCSSWLVRKALKDARKSPLESP